MFSRMSADRFEKERSNPVGPGSYRIPAVFDDASVATDRTDRSQDTEFSVGSSFQVFEDAQERVTPRTPPDPSENRAPPCPPAGDDTKGNAQDNSDMEQLRKRLLSAEASAGDYAVAKRSVARAHSQVQAKDRQMEELRRQVEDLITHQAQAQKRIGELEQEKHLHRKVLSDKDETIVALQKSIQHSKAQLEDRNRRPEAHDLASTRELAVEQAHRLKEQDAQLQERTRELEAAHQYLDCLEKQFMSHFEATEVRLKQLTQSQERIHTSVLERDAQSTKRARELERVLKERRSHEAKVVSELSVRQASLDETVELLAQEQLARKQAEASARSLAGELEALKCQAPEPPRREEIPEDLPEKFAELRGRLFLAEQAETLGKGRRQMLEEALAVKSAEVNRHVEAQEDLRRSVEELQSAKLEVEACNEVQSAELEALRIEVEELRSHAHGREAKAEALCDKAVVSPEASAETEEAEASRDCIVAVAGREAFAEAFGTIAAGLEEAKGEAVCEKAVVSLEATAEVEEVAHLEAECADAADKETASVADAEVEAEDPQATVEAEEAAHLDDSCKSASTLVADLEPLQACGNEAEAEGAGAGSDADEVAACVEEIMQPPEADGAGASGDEAAGSLEESIEAEGTYSDDAMVSARDDTEAGATDSDDAAASALDDMEAERSSAAGSEVAAPREEDAEDPEAEAARALPAPGQLLQLPGAAVGRDAEADSASGVDDGLSSVEENLEVEETSGDEAAAPAEEGGRELQQVEETRGDGAAALAEEGSRELPEVEETSGSEAAAPAEEGGRALPEAETASGSEAPALEEAEVEADEAEVEAESTSEATAPVDRETDEAEAEAASASERTALVDEDVDTQEVEVEVASASEADDAGVSDDESSASIEEVEASEVVNQPEGQEISDVPAEDSEPMDTSVSVAEAEGLDCEPVSRVSVASDEVCDRRDDDAEADWAPSRTLAACVIAHAMEAVGQTQPRAVSLSKDADGTVDLQIDSASH